MRTMKRSSAVAQIVVVAVAVTGSAIAFAPPARAQGSAVPTADARAKAEARTHFERGVHLGETGAYREAAAEFDRAYRLAPHFAVLFNLGQAYVALGQPVEAVDVLRRYLSEGGTSLPGARRSEVEAIIKQQQSRISTITIDANVDGAVLLVDSVAVGRSPLPAPLRVARGEHQITAVMDGYRATPRTINLAGDDKVRVSVVLERELASGGGVAGPTASPVAVDAPPTPAGTGSAPGAPAASPRLAATSAVTNEPAPSLITATPGTEQPGDAGAKTRRTAAVIVGAVGLAVGGAALIHYVWNKGRNDDYEEAKVNDPAKANSIRNASKVTVGLAVGAGALLTTGVVLVAW